MSHRMCSMSDMHSHSTPPILSGPCWQCVSFQGMAYQGSVALCRLSGGPRVRSSPATGCSAFDREPGTDDEPGPPGGMPAVHAWAPNQREPSKPGGQTAHWAP